MTTPPKKRKKVKAFGIVGVESKALYMDERAVGYAVFFDGFVAEQRLYELKGRGLKVSLENVTISYVVPSK